MSNVKNTFIVPEANGFHELEQDEVKKIKEEAWSVESMPGHDAANLATKYIGSSFEDLFHQKMEKPSKCSTISSILPAVTGMVSGCFFRLEI